jgi:hypothetical protein
MEFSPKMPYLQRGVAWTPDPWMPRRVQPVIISDTDSEAWCELMQVISQLRTSGMVERPSTGDWRGIKTVTRCANPKYL